MKRVFLTKNFRTLPPSEMPDQLDSVFQNLQEQLNDGSTVTVKFADNDKLPEGAQSGDIILDFTNQRELKIGIFNGKETIYPNLLLGFIGQTSSALPPSTDELATDGDWGYHIDTNLGKYYLARNFGGAIKSIELL